MTIVVRRAGVLGSPIAHSLSPALHTAAYRSLDLPWEYAAHEVDEAGLAGFLAGLDSSWVGLSVTMPLKRALLEWVDEISPVAAEVGVANTVLVDPGPDGRVRLRADNTDIPGLADALRAHGVGVPVRPLVLGAGATGCSAVAALHRLGARQVRVAVRNPARAGAITALAERLGVPVELTGWDLPAGHDLVVATTPRGSTDALAVAVPEAPGVLFDVLYDPWPTPLAAAWAARGGRVLGGFELLLHQAALQVTLMTGQAAPLADMRQAGERALAERAGHAAR